jgi:hypothetical protein
MIQTAGHIKHASSGIFLCFRVIKQNYRWRRVRRKASRLSSMKFRVRRGSTLQTRQHAADAAARCRRGISCVRLAFSPEATYSSLHGCVIYT